MSVPSLSELEACLKRNESVLKKFLAENPAHNGLFEKLYETLISNLEVPSVDRDTMVGTVYLGLNAESRIGTYIGSLSPRPADRTNLLIYSYAYLLLRTFQKRK